MKLEDAFLEWGPAIEVSTFEEELCTRRPPEGQTCLGIIADDLGMSYVWDGKQWVQFTYDIGHQIADLGRRVEALEAKIKGKN
jgi:hypothetical protein